MPYIHFQDELPVHEIDVDLAICLLSKSFPQMLVIGNYYERKRERLSRSIREFAEQGKPLFDPDRFWKELARDEQDEGPGWDISIKIDEKLKLKGFVTRSRIHLTSESQIDVETISKFEATWAELRKNQRPVED